nr:E3 ubiquitin-protein ligase Topors-like [Anser cygnoides]
MSQPRQELPAEAPREETCIICLGPLANTAQLEPCTHSFCRDCIQPWAAHRATCPLCCQAIIAIVRLVPRPTWDASACRPRGRFQHNMGPGQRRRRPSNYQSHSVSPRRRDRSPSMPWQLICSFSWHWEQDGRRRTRSQQDINPEDPSWLQWATMGTERVLTWHQPTGTAGSSCKELQTGHSQGGSTEHATVTKVGGEDSRN